MKNGTSEGRGILFVGALVGMTVIVGGILSTAGVGALSNSGVDNLSVEIPSSCTISATGQNHTKTIVSGTYVSGIGKTTMKVLCNDKDGYVMYTIGASGDNNDMNDSQEGNTDLVSSAGSAYNIETGVYNESTSVDSSWAMKVNAVAGDYAPTLTTMFNSGNYVAVPGQWEKLATWSSGVIDYTKGSSLETTYEVYAEGTQPAGTYKGMVKYVLLHPSSSTKPTTLEEAFAAYYEANHLSQLDGHYKMQDMDPSICNATNITGEASQLQLIDERDHSTYWATKLADGNCWMTQSLDLDLISDTTAQNYVALTSENTDIDPNTCDTTNHTCTTAPYATGYSIDQSTNVITWVPVRSTMTELNSTNWKNDNNTPYSWDRATAYPENNQATAGNHGLAGNYYNWTASIASSSSSGFTTNNADATNSICPKGWRLPSVASQEFGNLLTAEGIIASPTSTSYISGKFNSMITAPLYLVRAGNVNSGSLGGSGSVGYYWSSTGDSSNNALSLNFGSGSVAPQGSYGRSHGWSVRCVARSQ